MTLWTALELVAATGGVMRVPFDASGVSIDTRTLRPGDLFVALVGTTDGHAHAAEALVRGAAGLLVSGTAGLPENAPVLLVDDTLAALHGLGRAGRRRFRGRVVAVTGSVGKTTTKEMLRAALAPFGAVHAAEASYNNHWGVPLTLARLPADAAFCVAEIGMNHPGEILPLGRMVGPDVAVITTIAPAHIGHMGSLEAIADEKASLFEALGVSGVAVMPSDAPFAERVAARAPGRVLRFGPEGEVLALSVETAADAVHLTALVAGVRVAVRLRAPGAHIAHDALAALAACHALGLDAAEVASGLEDFTPLAGRGQQRRIHGGAVLLLDESYNASSASVRAALAVLRGLPAQRRLAVLGDMLELGSFGPSEHESLAPDVAQAADLLYACGPLMRGLFDQVPPRLRGVHADDAEHLAPIVAAALRPGDAVLVKGSLGSRMRVVVRALEAPGFTETTTGAA